MAQGELLPEFQVVEDRLSELRRRYTRGELDDAAYQFEVKRLTLRDAAGDDWWLGGETGAWHRWDGRSWVASTPPSRVQPQAGRPPLSIAKPERAQMRPLLLGCGGGLALVLVATIVLLAGGWFEYQAMPKIIEGLEPQAAESLSYPLSPDQQNVVDRLGHPEAFAILFYEEEAEDGSRGDVRFETWTYYTSALEYSFINGEIITEESVEIEMLGDLVAIPYRPEQFTAYMNLEEVIASAGLDTYLVLPLEKELVQGGEVFFADELTFGLKRDELLYVEALALAVEG